MLNDKGYVLKQIEERDIHFIRLWFADALGQLKSLSVTNNEIENALENGMGFDGSSIAGFSSVQESDLLAFPIASTFQVLPWRPTDNGVARMFCDIRTPDGESFAGDTRQVLKSVVEDANKKGYYINLGPELEYYYFKDDKGTEPIDNAGYFDLTSADQARDLRRDTILTLEKMSIPVEYSHHEFSPSQQEIDLRYSDALSMGDSVMTYRLVVKEIAQNHGVYASFMPMPSCAPAFTGSGMHIHQSLFNKSGENVFYDEDDPNGMFMSDIAKHYVAGLLKYVPEYLLVTNQYVNSYKRLMSRRETTRFICWGKSNRSALVRIPAYRKNDEITTRIESRNPDPAVNPYLAFAVMIAAGLRGIEEKLPLMDPCDGMDISNMSRNELDEAGIGELPRTLDEALANFENSEFMHEVLGDHIFSYLVENKHKECDEYSKIVTGWELSKLLPVL